MFIKNTYSNILDYVNSLKYEYLFGSVCVRNLTKYNNYARIGLVFL